MDEAAHEHAYNQIAATCALIMANLQERT